MTETVWNTLTRHDGETGDQMTNPFSFTQDDYHIELAAENSSGMGSMLTTSHFVYTATPLPYEDCKVSLQWLGKYMYTLGDASENCDIFVGMCGGMYDYGSEELCYVSRVYYGLLVEIRASNVKLYQYIFTMDIVEANDVMAMYVPEPTGAYKDILLKEEITGVVLDDIHLWSLNLLYSKNTAANRSMKIQIQIDNTLLASYQDIFKDDLFEWDKGAGFCMYVHQAHTSSVPMGVHIYSLVME